MVLFSFPMFGDFAAISSLNPLWSKNTFCIFSFLLCLLKLFYCPICSILLYFPFYGHLKIIYSLLLSGGVPYKCQLGPDGDGFWVLLCPWWFSVYFYQLLREGCLKSLTIIVYCLFLLSVDQLLQFLLHIFCSCFVWDIYI